MLICGDAVVVTIFIMCKCWTLAGACMFRWFTVSIVELTDGAHSLQDSKSDIAFCDPFRGLISIQSCYTGVCLQLVFSGLCPYVIVFLWMSLHAQTDKLLIEIDVLLGMWHDKPRSDKALTFDLESCSSILT